jgi:hypothetical protein
MNKILHLLPLFLLFPAATQCMEQEIVVKTKTMQQIKQEIKNNRNTIYQERLQNFALGDLPIDHILFQHLWPLSLGIYKWGQTKEKTSFPENYDVTKVKNAQEMYLRDVNFTNHGYSFLGLATIAIRGKPISDGGGCYKYREHKKVLLREGILNRIPFTKTKEHIQQLLAVGFEPTDKDKDAIFLATYKKCGPSIIKKILLLQNLFISSRIETPYQIIIYLSKIEMPKEIVDYILLLMFITELPL